MQVPFRCQFVVRRATLRLHLEPYTPRNSPKTRQNRHETGTDRTEASILRTARLSCGPVQRHFGWECRGHHHMQVVSISLEVVELPHPCELALGEGCVSTGYATLFSAKICPLFFIRRLLGGGRMCALASTPRRYYALPVAQLLA
jgi:hypothetical protein